MSGARAGAITSGSQGSGRSDREKQRVRSKRVLGAVALIAIVVAAISFAVVDVSTSAASGCLDSNVPCTDTVVPPIAVVCAVIGSIALIAAAIPAVTWIVYAFSSQH